MLRKVSARQAVIAVVALGGVGLALVLFARWWTEGRFHEATNDAYLQSESVTIAPKVGGYVTEVLVGDNAAVTAGLPLLRIDDTSYRAAVDMAEAAAAGCRADLIRLTAEVSRQKAGHAKALAQLDLYRSAARFAADDMARYVRLASSGADTTQRRDQAISLRDQAKSQVLVAQADVDSASSQLEVLKAQIQQGRAALMAAEAKLRSAQIDLDGTVIVAPIDGRVGDRTVRRGQYVQPGTRLMSVVPTQDVYLVANFKETQVGRVRPGQRVAVTLDAFPRLAIDGTVESLAPGTGAEFALLPAENATGNFTKIVQRVPVRIRLALDARLRDAVRPGLSAHAEIDTKPGGSGS
jgi:membrane fusion protein (multidrug efflux system)